MRAVAGVEPAYRVSWLSLDAVAALSLDAVAAAPRHVEGRVAMA